MARNENSNKMKKTAKQKRHYLNVIKNDIIENKSNYPKISNLIKGINNVLVENRQKPKEGEPEKCNRHAPKR